jgi:RHS repeat-associated protein
VRDYVWLDGSALAQIEYPGATPTTGYAYYYHVDQIGLPRVLTNQKGQVVWSAAARPYGDLTETTTADPVSGRTVVANLRLPGQYDERLLGSVGLQGPYYNWNRWYLPGVGRYLELDPALLRAPPSSLRYDGSRPEWNSYVGENPLSFEDVLGLDRYKWCSYCQPYKQACKKATDKVCSTNVGRAICCAADRADCETKAKSSVDVPAQMLMCREEEALCNVIGSWPSPKPMQDIPLPDPIPPVSQ